MKEAFLLRQIEQELSQIQVMVTETGRMLSKVQRTADKDYLGTVALNLPRFYTAVERILVAIAKEIDATVPQGENWHQALLAQMVIEVPGVRQPVLATQTQQGYKEPRLSGQTFIYTTISRSQQCRGLKVCPLCPSFLSGIGRVSTISARCPQ